MTETPPIPTGTPDDDPDAALHWAAIAVRLAESRERQGNPLTDAEQTVYDRFLAAAHRHGHTEQDIRDHLAHLPRPSRVTEPATVAACRADYQSGAAIRRRFDQRIQDGR